MKKPSSSKSKATTAPAGKGAAQHGVPSTARAESTSTKKQSNEALNSKSAKKPSSVKSQATQQTKSPSRSVAKAVAAPATRKPSNSALSAKKPSPAKATAKSVTKGRGVPWEVEVAVLRDAVGSGRSGSRATATEVSYRSEVGDSVLSGSAGRKSIPKSGGSQKRTVTEIKEKKARPPSSSAAKIFLDEVSGNVKSKKTESLSVSVKKPAKKTESLSDLVVETFRKSPAKKLSPSVKKESPDNRAKRLREEGAANNLAESAYDEAAEHLEQQTPSKRRHSTEPARYTPSARQPGKGKQDREPPKRSRIYDPLPTSSMTDMRERKPVAWITKEIVEEICGHIAEGVALHKVLASDLKRMPSRNTFFRHVATNSEYSKLYSEAVQLRGEYYADQISELADEARGCDSDEIQAIKLQVNTRQWLASRLLPKRYGDKMIVAGDADNPLVTQLVQGAEALKRKIKGEPKDED